MKKIQTLIIFNLLLFSNIIIAQYGTDAKKIVITGKIVEKTTQQNLEYTTITFVNTKFAKAIFGGITNEKGEFSVEVRPGTYNIKIEYLALKPLEIKDKSFSDNSNLGTIYLQDNSSQLNEVVVRAEKSSVEIKLDKKVFNVGKDLIVKGGNASDVLQNVPSITVDSDGNVSLRGNDNVKILIDGRPANSTNIADALKSIPADALDKVEVISNPSARYDAEGGAGIVNIVLKKGKTNGLNGTVTATVGNPKNYGLTGSVNFKSEKFNVFSGFGYNDSKTPGFNLTNSDYFDNNRIYQKTINEYVDMARSRKGFNFNFGTDWYLSKLSTWSNNISHRKSESNVPQTSNLQNIETANNYTQNRFSDQVTSDNNIEYSTNFTQKFKKEGQKLTFDGAFSQSLENDNSLITGKSSNSSVVSIQKSKNFQTQINNLLQTDFVLPLGKNSQFETGYRGNFNSLIVDYAVGNIDNLGNYTAIPNFTNVFQYKEKINALYTQFGSKTGKLSYLFGLRYENTNLDINLLSTNNLKNKRYDNFFPSAFLSYQLTDKTSFSVNYSKRIARPRNRFMMPFSNYTSNINIFQGNPDINPAFTDALELSFLSKIEKLTLTSTVYYNKTKDLFQFTRRPNGDYVGTTPVSIATPINLDSEERYGLEFNANYTPFKWWKLNANFNLFKSQISGNYSYVLNNTTAVISQYIDKSAGSWFAKLNSNITFPFKINFQSNVFYTAPQNTAQGQSLATIIANAALSKDVLKDKATITLNVSDIFNQMKMVRQFNTPTLDSYIERQGRMRQVNVSFTYRFNKQKNERERPTRKSDDNGGGGDF